MLVSLFCIGFASWSIVDPQGLTISTSGGIQAQESQEVLLSEIGINPENIGKHPDGDTLYGTTSFKYALVDSTATFAKTTLTLTIGIFAETLEALELDHDIKYALVVECVNPNANAFDIFTQTNYLTAPTVATAHLVGLPHLTVSGETTGTTKTVNGQKISKLSAYFPLRTSTGECLFHLTNRSTSTAGKVTYVTFTFEFTPAANVNSDYVKAICMTAYTFNVRVAAKK